MTPPNLSVAWDADAQAAPVGNAKEPPQRKAPLATTPADTVASLVAAAQDAFKYDWRARLNDVRPHTHPQMRYDHYRSDKDKLFAAVKILNATSFVNSERASARVIAAFDRLWAAVKMQNEYNRQTNHAMSDDHFASHSMKALMDLTVFTPQGTHLRHHLEQAWLERMMDRDAGRDGWLLRIDMERGLRESIPGSPEAALYQIGLIALHEKDQDATRLQAIHPMLVSVQT